MSDYGFLTSNKMNISKYIKKLAQTIRKLIEILFFSQEIRVLLNDE